MVAINDGTGPGAVDCEAEYTSETGLAEPVEIRLAADAAFGQHAPMTKPEGFSVIHWNAVEYP